MLESLLFPRRKTLMSATDVNVDSKLATISNGLVVGSSASLTLPGSSPSSTSAVAIGYWDGVIYVLKADGVYKFDAGTLAYLGVTGWAGRTIPLNSASYLYKGVLYFGQGRGRTGKIEALNLKTGTYYTYPTLAYDYGALYADDTYLYSLGNIYKSSGFSSNAIRRCKHGGTQWEDVVCTGTFAHGFSGADATQFGDEVWITGGGSITGSGGETDGSSYTDPHYVNLKTMEIKKYTVDSPGFMTYDMASCVWGGALWAVKPSAGTITRFAINGAITTYSVPTAVYHQPCLRVGDLFYYLTGYSSTSIVRFKLSGGL